MSIKFGTDGWRGLIARDFTFENVEHVIQAFCDVFQTRSEPDKIFLGYDRRFLSRQFAETVASVLCANGLEVHFAKQYCPTPCISWMTKAFNGGAGVMVTASHNPFDWNGIKFKEADGSSASSDYTNPIEAQLQKNNAQGKTPLKLDLKQAQKQGLFHEFDPMDLYVKQLQSFVDVTSIRNAGWHIVSDAMHGSGGGYFQAVLLDGVKELHGDSNPSFQGIQPEPIAKNLEELAEAVAHEGIDIGLATDGDADRIGTMDETGRFIDSHHLFALILQHLVEDRELTGDVVKTVSTTQMIDALGKQYGLKIECTAIGFKNICARFHDLNPLIGGEESGGISVVEHVPERDGILSGLLILEMMSQRKKSLAQLVSDLQTLVGAHHFRRDDFKLPAEQADAVKARLSDFSVAELSGVSVNDIDRSDGCRLNLNDGSWVLMRPSGTEPLLRLYAEASSVERVDELLTAIKQALAL